MKYSLTIAYTSNREFPEFGWFTDSLLLQLKHGDDIQIVCPSHKNEFVQEVTWTGTKGSNLKVVAFPDKPTVWAGQYRLTKEDWWSKSNSLNSSLCMATGDYFCTMDDRSVLQDGWLDAIRRQMDSPFPYVLAGAYEKRHSMTVENGVIKNAGIVTGVDNRKLYCEEHYVHHGMKPPYKSPGEWCYGCCTCLPTEWALEVNGWFEGCDSLGGEDYIFGKCLEAAGKPVFYEPRMMMIEDRTEGLTGPIAKRTDKGISPNDKSHKILENMRGVSYAPNTFHIRELRASIQAGKPWPIPTEPTRDWFDGQPISEM